MGTNDNAWPIAPGATLDFSVDWTDWLANNETISSHDWTVPAALTENSASESGGICTVWLTASASVGTVCTVYNTITTNQGRTDIRSLVITIRNR